jgi:hypothetical protein
MPFLARSVEVPLKQTIVAGRREPARLPGCPRSPAPGARPAGAPDHMRHPAVGPHNTRAASPVGRVVLGGRFELVPATRQVSSRSQPDRWASAHSWRSATRCARWRRTPHCLGRPRQSQLGQHEYEIPEEPVEEWPVSRPIFPHTAR